MIERKAGKLSVRRQCRLLGVSRSSLYYESKGITRETLHIMRLIDRQYTRTPFYGVEKMTRELHRQGITIGHNRLRKLMRMMGLEAIYPRPRTSLCAPVFIEMS